MVAAPTETADLVQLAQKLETGRCPDTFAFLGLHDDSGESVVRTFQPEAAEVDILARSGRWLARARRVAGSNLFVATIPAGQSDYRFRIKRRYGPGSEDVEDPYRFPSDISDLDRHLIGEGTHLDLYRKLGAHPGRVGNVAGCRFAVWAPNAERVSVVGDFNAWDGRRHVMRGHPSVGIWDIFIPGVQRGAKYKFEIVGSDGNLLPLKADPFAAYSEQAPGNASIVFSTDYAWADERWLDEREISFGHNRPVSIYEVHLGSWRQVPEDGQRPLTYTELADQLIPYVLEIGATHVELMPVNEYPFDGSWGYQPTALFSPTSRFGDPDEFRGFVDACHSAGLGVILDWVGAHFPSDSHGLGRFDGTALFEHEDPRRGLHADWGTLIYNFGRREVQNFLLSNALYWVREFHIDALRLDAVASMLYHDYSRPSGEWLPNEFGGNENLEAVEFLKRLNEHVHAEGAITVAEESTAWPGVSRPVYAGGLGFSYKWNMGWMNDTLSYLKEDPIHRKHHHDQMTFGLVYGFDENFILPLSHDEVVHGKGSILGRAPGDAWQKLANVRAYYGFMFAHPGKKLMFMGDEFAQPGEWSHERSLDWHLLQDSGHAGVRRLVCDLNRTYQAVPSLHELDCEPEGFRWIDWNDRDNSVLSWVRFDASGQWLVCVANFTPVVRHDYELGVPAAVPHQEIINTDAVEYGGSGCGNKGQVTNVQDVSRCGYPATMRVTLPPLATVYFSPKED